MSSTTPIGRRPYRHNDEPWTIDVLIVDDTQMDREWIAGQLRSMTEYEPRIEMACGLDEARGLIDRHSFHVALVDYRLAEDYGDAVVRLINARQKQCATIMISGHSMAEVSLYGLNAGATAAIRKDDLNPELLETTIRFAMANVKRGQAT